MNKRHLLILGLLAFVVAVVSCGQKSGGQASEPREVSLSVGTNEFEKIISDSDHVLVVDMRTPSEYKQGHLPRARLLNVNQGTFRTDAVPQLPTTKLIAVYCASGYRSRTAARILIEEGYEAVNLSGGFLRWKSAGKEIVK